jgi:hypothetical protein
MAKGVVGWGGTIPGGAYLDLLGCRVIAAAAVVSSPSLGYRVIAGVVSSPPPQLSWPLPWLCCPCRHPHHCLVPAVTSCSPPTSCRARRCHCLIPTVMSCPPLPLHRTRCGYIVPATVMSYLPPLHRTCRHYVIPATVTSYLPPLRHTCRCYVVPAAAAIMLHRAHHRSCVVPPATVASSSPLRLCPPWRCCCVHPTIASHRRPYPRILPAGVHASLWRSGRVRGGVGFVVLLGLADVGDVVGLSHCGLVGLGDVAGSGRCTVVVEQWGDRGGSSERQLVPAGARQPR